MRLYTPVAGEIAAAFYKSLVMTRSRRRDCHGFSRSLAMTVRSPSKASAMTIYEILSP